MNRLLQALGPTLLLGSAPALAQNFTVSSISAGDFGTVVSPQSGTTTFRANPATGTVTRIAGSGLQLSSTSVRSLVTVSCGNQPACNTDNALLSVSFSGTSTGRAGDLQNFTVSTSGASAVLSVPPGTGNAISFQLGPVGRAASRTFWIGYDFSVNGDNAGGATGDATAFFAVTASRVNGNSPSSSTGSATARVLRGLSLAHSSDLAFGRITLPTSGAGTVVLSPASGAVTVSGNGVRALGSVETTAARFTATGEGGQGISVSVPPSFTMSSGTGSIIVTTTSTASGPQVLSGSLGAAGTLQVNVGGSFNLSTATEPAAYSGSFSVTVAYN